MNSATQYQPAVELQAAPQPFHVLAKPTGPKCNLQCEYCFYKEKEDSVYLQERKANSLNMDERLLRKYIEQYIASQSSLQQSEINFLWQGGEPTMRGISFYRLAVKLQGELCPAGKTIHNHFQTNGILINENWAKFFSENDFLIGISIDGPQFIHDMYRKTLSGGGSFNKVIEGLNWLKKYNVAFNTMTVVGRHNEKLGAQVYQALKALGSDNMQFIPLVERFDENQQQLSGPVQDEEQKKYKVTPWSVSRQGYGHFMNAVFDEWIKQDVGKVSIQLIDVQLGIWLGQSSSLCIYRKNCGSGVVMEHNGDVYSCDHFVYDSYKLGNMNEQSLVSLALSEQQKQFGEDKFASLPTECMSCDYQKACYGGCPKHRFTATKSSNTGLNYLCQSYLRFFDHAGPWIHRIATLIRQGSPAASIMQHPQLQGRSGDINKRAKPKRNAPCPCGSAKKFKHCCAS